MVGVTSNVEFTRFDDVAGRDEFDGKLGDADLGTDFRIPPTPAVLGTTSLAGGVPACVRKAGRTRLGAMPLRSGCSATTAGHGGVLRAFGGVGLRASEAATQVAQHRRSLPPLEGCKHQCQPEEAIRKCLLRTYHWFAEYRGQRLLSGTIVAGLNCA